MSGTASTYRVGIGVDAHRFAPDRALILGGVHLRDHDGLEGHSDADVLAHAIMDALLGAAGLEDIGHHFPDSDPAFKGADSLGSTRQRGHPHPRRGMGGRERRRGGHL